MKAKVVFCLILFLSFADVLNAAANQKPCTTSEGKQALNEADSLKDWDALHRSFIRFGHCDDGAIGEGYSDTVGRLLARDWEHIGTLGKLVVSDKKFESFVLRHINQTLPTDTLKAIANHAEKSCPADETALCRKILQSTQAASAQAVPPECTKVTRVHGSSPKGLFNTLPTESYERSPSVKFLIQEDGSVSDSSITLSSGVADLDRKVQESVSQWKYEPRPVGCGVIENQMTVIIHWGESH
jgi:TonB family protein